MPEFSEIEEARTLLAALQFVREPRRPATSAFGTLRPFRRPSLMSEIEG